MKGQAQIVLGKLLEQAAAGQRPDSGATVADLLAQYMAVAELDPSTREGYEGYIRRTIMPALGTMELRKVRGPILDTLYTRLRRCGNLACTGKPFTEHSNFPMLMIERGSLRPVWQQVTGVIREAVSSGRLVAGDQLPSIRELASQYDVPVAALRRALTELAGEGIIAVQQGRRAVVCDGTPQTAPQHVRPAGAHDPPRA